MIPAKWKVAEGKPAHKCPLHGCRNHSRTPGARSWKARLCSRHAMHLWRIEHPNEAAYAQIKDRAKRRQIPFTITFEDYMRTIQGTQYAEQRGRASHCLHLDRIDPLRGYEPGNIRVATASENYSKGATTDKERRRAFVQAKLAAYQREPEEEPSQHVATDVEPF